MRALIIGWRHLPESGRPIGKGNFRPQDAERSCRWPSNRAKRSNSIGRRTGPSSARTIHDFVICIPLSQDTFITHRKIARLIRVARHGCRGDVVDPEVISARVRLQRDRMALSSRDRSRPQCGRERPEIAPDDTRIKCGFYLPQRKARFRRRGGKPVDSEVSIVYFEAYLLVTNYCKTPGWLKCLIGVR